MNLLDIFRFRDWAAMKPAPVECPATQEVARKRKGNFVTMTRLLMAETGIDTPALRRVVGG